MELHLSDEEEALRKAVHDVVTRASSPNAPVGELQHDVLDALDASGFLDVIDQGGRPLDAALVVEAVARSGACVPVSGRALVAPSLGLSGLGRSVGLASPAHGRLVRFGADVDTVVVLGADGVTTATADGFRAERVASRWGFPLARVDVDDSRPVDVPAERLQIAWSIALAAEMAGLMAGAVEIAADHVKGRIQFGRPIGSYQAVQHRLARAHVVAQGTSWLARQAAWHGDAEHAYAAACFAADGAKEVLSNTQQVSGAIGITDEFNLVRFTAPLATLSAELGGSANHARLLGRARYASGATRRVAPGRRPATVPA